MLLQTLVIRQFRNREEGVFVFDPKLTAIVGENARGKTNLLEAIFFVINGVGFRESREEELVQVGKKDAMVEAGFLDGIHKFNFKVHLTKRPDAVEKQYFVEKAKKRHLQYIGQQTKAVLFAPEQIEIVTGPPEARRTYFNKLLSQYDAEYKKRILNLESALRRRNKLLEHVKDEDKLREELPFWNGYLAEQSSYIVRKREEYVAYLNSHPKLDHKEFGVVYDKNEATLARFEEVFEKERILRKTLIGPHKDDIYFQLKAPFDKNIQHYGSRSEQRLTVFWLKMNEISYCEEMIKRRPIVLLDDVFSEFDRSNRKLILKLIHTHQTILTTTDEDVLDHIKASIKLIKV